MPPKILISPVHHLVAKKLWNKEQKKHYEAFKEIWDRFGDKILKEIVDVVGEEFDEKDINVYVIPTNYPKLISSSFPLILKLKKNPYFTIYILIHELIHRILMWKNKNLAKDHVMVVFLTQEVFKRVFGNDKLNEMKKLELELIKSYNVKEIYEKIEKLRDKINLPIL